MYPPPDLALPDVNALTSLSHRQYAADGVVPAESTRRRMLFAMPWAQMGGSELAMLHLMHHVCHFHGWDVSVLLFQPSFGQDAEGNLELKHDWMHRLYEFTHDVVDLVALAPFHRTAELLRYVLETRRPEVLLFTNGRWVYQQLALIRFVAPRMVIADYNHMVYKYWNGGGNPRYGTNHTEFIDYHFTASNNVTEAMRSWVTERGFDEEKVSTCYIGTDLSIILTGKRKLKARREVRASLNINPHAALVLFAGRFVMEKGLDVLVAAVKRLVPKKPQVSFLIVGDGDSVHLLDDISQPGRVVVHPPVYDGDMPRIYAAADILLLPSVNEGIALVLYEAMAAGLVVVATDVGGQNELVTPERGILLRPGSAEEVTDRVVRAISSIIDHPERYDRMRKTARRDIQRYFNIQKFRKCVIDGMVEWHMSKEYNPDTVPAQLLTQVREALLEERKHGTWALRRYPQQLDRVLSIAYVGSVCGHDAVANRELCDAFEGIGYDESTFAQFRQRHPTVHLIVVSSHDGAENALPDPNMDFIKASSGKAKRCSPFPLMRQTALACDTELIAFADESLLIDGPELQELANTMRADQWDVFGVMRSAPDGKDMANETAERIRWHDRNRDMVRTCVLSALETDAGTHPAADESSQAPVDASIAPYLVMARTEALRMYFQDLPEADFDITQMFVGFWKTGLKIGLAPGRIAIPKAAMEREQVCQREKGQSWGKDRVFEVFSDKEECAEGLKAVRHWPKK